MRLTPAGQVVLGSSLVLFIVGLSFGYVELNVVVAAGIVSLVLASCWTMRRPRVELQRAVVPPRVVRGDPAYAQITLRSPDNRTLPALLVRDHVGGEAVDAVLPRIGPGRICETNVVLPTARRGVIEIGPLSVVRQDPFGLTQSAKSSGSTETLWVYPRIHQVTPLSSGRRRDLEGPTHDGASGSITFHALREYVSGDDLRLIHWRSTARTGTLMVRQQADPSQPQTTIILDTHAASYQGESFEAAVEAVASLVVASTSRRFPVRLLTGEGLLSSGEGRAGRSSLTSGGAALLEHLTRLEASEDEGRLGEAATRMSGQPGGNSLVVVTGTPEPPELMAVEALRQRYVTMAVLRFQPDVAPGMSWGGGVVDLVAPDGETFAALWNERT